MHIDHIFSGYKVYHVPNFEAGHIDKEKMDGGHPCE